MIRASQLNEGDTFGAAGNFYSVDRVSREGNGPSIIVYTPTGTLLHTTSFSAPTGAYDLTRAQSDFWNQHNVTLDGTVTIEEDSGEYHLSMKASGSLAGASNGVFLQDAFVESAPDAGYQDFSFSFPFRFADGFEWVKGGKLPCGVQGGGDAVGCVSIDPDTPSGFSVRPMWRTNGALELYVYHVDKDVACGEQFPLIDPRTEEQYLASAGEWHELLVRVRMNTSGQADGLLQAWLKRPDSSEFEEVLDERTLHYWQEGVSWYGSERMIAYYFFGGSTLDWAPSTDQFVHVKEYKYWSLA